MKNGIPILVCFFVALICSVCAGQVCPPGFVCPPVVQQEQQQEVSALDWFKKVVAAPGTDTPENRAELQKYINRAVRTRNNSGCGTSSLVGRNADSIFLVSNAHVATNRPGARVSCEAVLKDLSGTETFSGVVIEGAYSSTQTTDWALIKADAKHMQGIEPIKLSIRMPNTSMPLYTWGMPRCEVAQGQIVKVVKVDGDVCKWLPNSIGGQSGSGVYQRGYQFCLLTWSYSERGGSLGAGQFTANIYKQSRNQTNDASERPDDLIPISSNPSDDLIEGYTHLEGEPRLATVGNFQDPVQDQFVANGLCIDGFVRQSGVGDYPIWGDPDAAPTDPNPPTDPVDPTDPVPPVCPPSGLDAESRKELEAAKALIDSVLDRGVQDKK